MKRLGVNRFLHYRKLRYIEIQALGNFTDTKGISQEFSDCGLRNDKSTNNSLRENYRLRDDHLKGTSHRKQESDLV